MKQIFKVHDHNQSNECGRDLFGHVALNLSYLAVGVSLQSLPLCLALLSGSSFVANIAAVEVVNEDCRKLEKILDENSNVSERLAAYLCVTWMVIWGMGWARRVVGNI